MITRNIHEVIVSAIKEGNGYISPNKKKMLIQLYSSEEVSHKNINDAITEVKKNFTGGQNCPNCNSKVTAFQMICNTCDYIFRVADESDIAIEELIRKMEENLAEFKSRPKPGLFDSVKKHYHIVFSGIALFWLVAIIILAAKDLAYSEIAFELMILFAVVAAFSIVHKTKKGKLSFIRYKSEKQKIQKQLMDFKNLSELAKKHYGKDKEVQDLLRDYNAERKSTKENQTKSQIFSILGYLLIGFSLIMIYTVLPIEKIMHWGAEDKIEEKAVFKDFQQITFKIVPTDTIVQGTLSSYLEVVNEPYILKISQINGLNDYEFSNDNFSLTTKVKFRIKKKMHFKGENHLKDFFSKLVIYIDLLDNEDMPFFENFVLSNSSWDSERPFHISCEADNTIISLINVLAKGKGKISMEFHSSPIYFKDLNMRNYIFSQFAESKKNVIYLRACSYFGKNQNFYELGYENKLVRIAENLFPKIPFIVTDTTVFLNNQEWFRYNISVDTFRNGDSIPGARSFEEFIEAGEAGKPISCSWDFKDSYDRFHGKLYNWYCVNDTRGFAPEGWHVATKEEWLEVEKNIGGDTDNYKLYKIDHGGKGTIIGGCLNEKGSFDGRCTTGYYWTSTEINNDESWLFVVNKNESQPECIAGIKEMGLSVRCVRD